MKSKDRKDLEAIMGVTLKEILKKTREVGFSGRCWGVGNNPFKGSHVTLAEEEEIVSVYVKDGKIHIAEYKITTRTNLGEKVREILKAKKLSFKEGDES